MCSFKRSQIPVHIVSTLSCNTKDDVVSRVGLHDWRHCTDCGRLDSILELLLHFAQGKAAKITTALEGAAVAALLGILGKDLFGAALGLNCIHVRLQLFLGGICSDVGSALIRSAKTGLLDPQT